jgi:hypothetical protein
LNTKEFPVVVAGDSGSVTDYAQEPVNRRRAADLQTNN